MPRSKPLGAAFFFEKSARNRESSFAATKSFDGWSLLVRRDCPESCNFSLQTTSYFLQTTIHFASSVTNHLEVPVREALLSDVYQTLSNSRAQTVRRFPSLGFRCVAPAPHAAPETVENPLSQPQSCDKLVDKVVF